MAVDIQHILDITEENGTAVLPPGEYEGTFVIGKSCKVIGSNTVLWCFSGPVLIAAEKGIKIENIKIDITGNDLPPEKNVSVYCKFPDTQFTGVEVTGAVIGIAGEEKYWGIPRKLSLGVIPAEKETEFSFEIYSPVDSLLSCGFYNVRLMQENLHAGINSISFTVGKIKSGMLLYGEITVRSAVTRRIVLTGEAGGEDAVPEQSPLFTADSEMPAVWERIIENYDPSEFSDDTEKETIEIPEVSDSTVHIEEIDEAEIPGNVREENVYLVSGETVPLLPKKYCIELAYSSTRIDLDIEAYLFMLGNSGRVEKNTDMIFFGNDHSACGSIRYIYSPDRRAMIIDLGTIPENIRRMALLFSIYGDKPVQTFDKLVDGEVSILCENGVHLHLRLDPALNRRTILALGLEKKDGIWELIPSGSGVAMPLEDICRSYGVNII